MRREEWTRDSGGCLTARWRNDPSPPFLPSRPVVNDLLTLPLAERLELVQTLWDSIAAEQLGRKGRVPLRGVKLEARIP